MNEGRDPEHVVMHDDFDDVEDDIDAIDKSRNRFTKRD